jgi:hypothetical protein
MGFDGIGVLHREGEKKIGMNVLDLERESKREGGRLCIY